MINIKKLIGGLLPEQQEVFTGSTAVTDPSIIEKFVHNESNTFLVSFPRTGSHWLRMIMELYFERPSLVRVFYYPENNDYLTLHTHDKELDVEREHVVYLYRDPIETVYSQLSFYSEDINDQARIVYWADQYGQHLDKWLCTERFTRKKTVLTYEGMKNNMVAEFGKITEHFGHRLDLKKLAKAAARITKDEVNKKTGHDPRVVQTESGYTILRDGFKKEYSQLVWGMVCEKQPHLIDFFSHL